MRILVTGASGYLGQHVLESALARPCSDPSTLHALVHSNAEHLKEALKIWPRHAKTDLQVCSLDLTDNEAVENWFNKLAEPIDVCIHTAALSIPSQCQSDPELAESTNNPTFFFDKLLRQQPTIIIALSTDQVYAGDQPPYREADEASPCNVYGMSKLKMENYLLENYGDQSILLRTSIILGPLAPILPERAHSTFFHFIKTRKGIDTTFYTDERRNVVYVDDVVDIIRYFVLSRKEMTSELCGVYNLGGPASVSRFEMAKAVFEHLGYDSKHLIAAKKADQKLGLVSPLDISLDMEKMTKRTGREFRDLKTMVRLTFPNTRSAT